MSDNAPAKAPRAKYVSTPVVNYLCEYLRKPAMVCPCGLCFGAIFVPSALAKFSECSTAQKKAAALFGIPLVMAVTWAYSAPDCLKCVASCGQMQMQLVGFVALWLLAVKVPRPQQPIEATLDLPDVCTAQAAHSPTHTHASQNVASADSKPKECSEGYCEEPQQASASDKLAGDFSDYVHVAPLTPAEAAEAAPGA